MVDKLKAAESRERKGRMAELITLTTKTRGRNTREVQYQGLGRVERKEVERDGQKEIEETVVTDGVLTSIEDALTLPGIEGALQRLLDFAVIGYNKFQRDAALDVDEFADYIEPDWNEDRISAFKRAVRALAKAIDADNPNVAEAADIVKAKMKRAEAVPAPA